jgi:glutamyl-tRNA synthetase
VGNLRTALLAWLFARTSGRRFLLRVEDLDAGRSSAAAAGRQLADLAAIGLDWDGDVTYQSRRGAHYRDAIGRLERAGLTYPCFCTRRDILDAPRAPHTPPGAYPGTCRDLTPEQVRAKRLANPGRPPALRLRTDGRTVAVMDRLRGAYRGAVDDFVIVRGDGTPAYNLAVVVDDGAAGVDQVVRGDDLLSSAPRQAYLAGLLGMPVPEFCHVPLALGHSGARLAKRDGAVTLRELTAQGFTPRQVLSGIAGSLGLVGPGELVDSPRALLARFDPAALPRDPWRVDGAGAWLAPWRGQGG